MAGGVRKQNGSWIGLWRESGVKKSKTLGRCSEMTKTQAREAVAEIVKRVNKDADKTLFGPFVEEVCFPFYTRKWKPSTRSKNVNRVEVHLIRPFRDCGLETFKREGLQDFLDDKAKTLSHAMVNHLRWDLRQIFGMAQAEGLIQRNPAQLLFTPRGAVRSPGAVLSVDQVRLLSGVLQPRESLIAKLAVLAGMRPGEIFALRWADVAETYVEVKQRVYEGVLDSPKSERGFRKVAIPESVVKDLEAWRETGGGSPGAAFVFPSEVGTPLSKNNVWRRNMKPRLKKVGLQWCNFQAMRRTFITLGKIAGGDPKVLADQAGHDIGVSVNVYTQSPIESKLKAVNALEKLVLG